MHWEEAPERSFENSIVQSAALNAVRGAAAITDYVEPSGRVMVRKCIVPGGSHAWFGGCADGSFTDAAGPDASAEVVRFFIQAGLVS